jgi:hypothetical protein
VTVAPELMTSENFVTLNPFLVVYKRRNMKLI